MSNPVTADSDPVVIATTGDGTSKQPAITRLSDGGYAIVWTRSNGDDLDVWVQKYGANGTPASAATCLTSVSDGDQQYAKVAATADGGFVAVWTGRDDFGSGIFQRRFDGDGQAIDSDDVQVNAEGNYNQNLADVTVLSGGRYFVTWQSFGQDGDHLGIYGRLYEADGTAVTSETHISTSTTGPQLMPAVASLSDGGYIVVWHGDGAGGTSFDVWSQRYDADGDTVGSETRINTVVTDFQYQPSVAGLADGGYVVAWAGRPVAGFNIYVQHFASDGTPATETQVNTTTASIMGMTRVCALDNGGWVVVWQLTHTVDYEDSYSVMAQVYDGDGNAVDGEITISTGDSAQSALPAVAATATGFTVVWGSDDNNETHEVLQRSYSVPVPNAAPALTGAQSDLSDTLINHSVTYSLAQLLSGYSDGDNDTLSITGLSADHGTVHDNGNDSWTITPATDYAGTVTLSYDVTDGEDSVAATQAFGVATYVAGEAERVNTFTDNFQGSAASTWLNNGGRVVVWDGDGDGGSGGDVFFQLFGADGDPRMGETQVNDYSADGQSRAAVAALDGGFVVVWTSLEQEGPGDGDGVYLRRFDTDGSPLDDGDVLVNQTLEGDQLDVAVTALTGGRFLVTWTNNSPEGDSDVYGRVFDGELNAGEEFRINSTTEGTQYRPAVTATAHGGFIVAWSGYGDGSSDEDVWLQRYDSTGAAIGGETRVNSNAVDEQSHAAMAALVDGGFIVTWQTSDSDGYGIAARRFDSGGQAIGSEFAVNTTTRHDQTQPKVVALNGGGWVVAWQSGYEDDTSYDNVYAQVYDAEGNKTGNEIKVTDTTSIGWEVMINLVATDDGFIISWTGNPSGDWDFPDVWQRSYTTSLLTPTFLTGSSEADDLDGTHGVSDMTGLQGDDTYHVDSVADLVHENASAGIDEVQASVNYTLGDNVENLTLTGDGDIDGTGNSLDNTITGNGGDNILGGGDGDDRLDGNSGQDTLSGGSGDDTYVVHDADTVIQEDDDGGTDTVEADTSTYTLGDNVENLVYAGPSSGQFTGIGNALDNHITGSLTDDTLSGGDGDDYLDGGAGGNDSLTGGVGNDTYQVDNAGDVVTELSGGGTDTVVVSGLSSYTLAGYVENLTYTGSAVFIGGGNALDNYITGGSGQDALNGGLGDDTLAGGLGSDSYFIDSLNDVAIENTDEGTDFVYTGLDGMTLAENIEYLVLTGTGNLSGTGNGLANGLYGTSGYNRLDGGAGADTMTGYAGNDTYIVDRSGDSIVEADGEGTDEVRASASFTLSADVENLVLGGTGSIDGTGNALANSLTGNSGNNRLDGGAGADTMAGGAGDDTYAVDDEHDTLVEGSGLGSGSDRVEASVSWTLAANFENLTLTGSGNINGNGNGIGNMLAGNSGNNVLDGLGGADIMSGGAGDDTYYVDNAGDQVSESGGEGTDWVNTTLTTYSLGVNVENLVFRGTHAFTGTGNALNNSISSGSGNDSLSGGDGNDVLNGMAGNDTLSGGNGDDLYIVDSSLDVVTEASSQGTDTVRATASFTLGTNVENLVLLGSAAIDGTGNAAANTLTGNSAGNHLMGGDGNDTLNGGAGIDSLYGGKDDDLYYVDDGSDQILEASGGGYDTVVASASYTLSNEVEKLIFAAGNGALTGYGNGGDNVMVGNAGDNTLIGMDGNDSLSGGAGNDSLVGGNGDDTYYVDGLGDAVSEDLNSGIDTVRSIVSYTLTNHVENLYLTGSNAIDGTGNGLENRITGNSGDNHLYGGDGSDSLVGGGGNDTLSGGGGDDLFYVDSASDQVVEAMDGGYDTVRVTVTYTLADNVERLLLQGGDDIDGAGNDLDNVLFGNIGDNELYGFGGADVIVGGLGDDTMAGGAGDDTYYVDSLHDVVVEADGGGIDTVRASVDYSLSDYVEILILTGSDNLSGFGNDLANTFTGNSGNNAVYGGNGNDTLSGGSGNDALHGDGGDDLMTGGAGNDTFYVDSAGDRVRESTDGGTDTIISAISVSLASNIENLILTGRAAIDGKGNGLNNWLTGNAGANHLTGGLGADLFAFYSGCGADTVMDFHSGQGDTIRITGDESDVVISQVGRNTVIDLGQGDSITVLNTLATDAGFLGAISYFEPG